MTTAIDSNIVSSLWLLEAGWQLVAQRLNHQLQVSVLSMCPAVYAELHAHPGFSPALMASFLSDARINIVPMTAAMWDLAGERYALYAARRRAGDRSAPRRILTDFLIGSHAALHADALMTTDQRLYRASFPELKLV